MKYALAVLLIFPLSAGCNQPAELVSAAPAPQPPSGPVTFPAVIEGDLFGSDIDTRLFRVAAALDNDQDARNLFLYGHNILAEMRDSMEPLDAGRKLLQTAYVDMQSDGERVTIRVDLGGI